MNTQPWLVSATAQSRIVMLAPKPPLVGADLNLNAISIWFITVSSKRTSWIPLPVWLPAARPPWPSRRKLSNIHTSEFVWISESLAPIPTDEPKPKLSSPVSVKLPQQITFCEQPYPRPSPLLPSYENTFTLVVAIFLESRMLTEWFDGFSIVISPT